jgi:hypothetical protein
LEGCYLEIHRGGTAQVVDLGDDPLTLGRGADNSVEFPTDIGVSRHHAVVEPVPGGWRLRDVGSSNGTYVNGQRVELERLLQPGDEIEMGSTRLVFGSADGRGKTGPRPAVDAPPPPVPPPPAPPPHEAQPAPVYLDLSEEWRGTTGAAHSAPPPAAPPAYASDRSTDEQPRSPRAPSPPPPRRPAHDTDDIPPLARPGRGSGHVRGVARGIQIRKSPDDQRDILAFRVDRYDDSGNRIAPVAVEMVGYRSGQINEGEEVEVSGRFKHGTLRVRSLVNLSTNASVRGMSGVSTAVQVVILVLVVGFILFIAVSVFTSATG